MPKKENGNFTEAELRAFIGEVPVASESKKQTEQSGLSPVTIRSTVASPLAEATGDEQGEESLFPAVREDAELSPTSVPSPTSDTSSTTVRRISSKQRKLLLDEYRATFLQVPRIVNRCPVFVSEEVRQKLDQIVLRLSETRWMSVTGLLENICRHHIAMYEDDIEQWRKL